MIRRLGTVLRPRDHREGEAGFTVIEVMVAMMVFAIMSIGIAYGITNALQLTQSSRGRETAVALASQDIDQMRQLAALSATGVQNVVSTSYTKLVGGVTYTVNRSANWVSSDGTLSACGSSSSELAYKNVAETVSWSGGHGASLSTTMTSSIAPPSAVSIPGDGTITISVLNAAGTGNAGVTIAITPVSGGGGAALATQPPVTNSSGCSIATNVHPGTYTVTATAPGGIDTKQSAVSPPAPIPSKTVVAGGSTFVSFTYDQAATITTTYASGGAILPISMPTTLYSTGQYSTMTPWGNTVVTSATSESMTVFPFPSYTMYAGTYNGNPGSTNCLSPNPAQWTVPNASGQVGTPVTPIGTSPGQTTVTTSPIMMGVFSVSGLSVGSWLVATTTTPASNSGDPGCSAGMTLRFPRITAANETFALPFGTWSLQYSTSLTGTVLSVLGGTNVNTVSPGTVSGSSLTGWTVMLDPRGQTS
ncbi:prepilin-type N-terminal cleavage/methylation domain-containing protein [Curtobacterium ammoniigenes]|uniref:prepilin-type N-terminal cleavage/methylation domain-containing protein n=1 Tax=Curtobacterium ammoniigenes TaxID=395387 RepID=UPI00082E0BC7|nr:prepilin-type N-terminal cleavage/methylation domain-containing protein [Curtobacterium ammoniigenes]